MRVESILFLIPDQFGYSAGYYYYCKYLLINGFKVSVVCLDMDKPKVNLPGNFTVHYLKMTSSLRYRFNLFLKVYNLRLEHQVFILKYLSGVSITKLFLYNKRVFLDIRSGSIRSTGVSRIIGNITILFESLFFKKVFILSKVLSKRLCIPKSKVIWLPLGAEELSTERKNYSSSFDLLYIGTLHNRNLIECIKGFAMFYNEYCNSLSLRFYIIGSGTENETNSLVNEVDRSGLVDIVTFHGELSHSLARDYFERCNYGVSFVPLTRYFNYQPPTKTFEYILSGLVCIATSTYANKELVNKDNGVLHEDNAESFYKALICVYHNRDFYKTNVVKATLSHYKWDKVVENILIPNILK